MRRALRAHGIKAWSCDLEPADDDSPFHIQADALSVMHWTEGGPWRNERGAWAGMIAHPECRFLSASGLHWNTRPGYEWRAAKTEDAIEFALSLWRSPPKMKIMENPRGKLGAILRGAQGRYCVQPYQLGDDASKETWLWTDNLELLPIDPALRCPGRWVTDPRNGRLVERWSNQTDSGQNRLGPSAERSALRAETYPGIANWVARSIAAWCAVPTLEELLA